MSKNKEHDELSSLVKNMKIGWKRRKLLDFRIKYMYKKMLT